MFSTTFRGLEPVAGSPGQAHDLGIEQAHGVGGIAHAARQQQRQERTQQEPEQGLCGNAAHGAGVRNAANGQGNGSEHHGDDHQLQRFDEQLADDVKDAERLLRTLDRDILEQQVIDGGPRLRIAACVQVLPQHHKGKACRQAADQRNAHPLGKRKFFFLFRFHKLLSSLFLVECSHFVHVSTKHAATQAKIRQNPHFS